MATRHHGCSYGDRSPLRKAQLWRCTRRRIRALLHIGWHWPCERARALNQKTQPTMSPEKRCDSLESAEKRPEIVRRLSLLNQDVSFAAFSQLLPRLIGVREIRLGWLWWMALPKELAGLRELRSLTVLNTPIQKFPDFLAACPHLSELVLRGTDIATIPATVEEFRALRSLDFSNNPLSQIAPELGRLPALRELQLADNGLRSLPESLSGLPSLRKLLLAGNRFSLAEAGKVRSWFRKGVVSVWGRDEVLV